MNMRVFTALLLLSAAPLTLSGSHAADSEWWSPEWLATSPYSPSFEVRDTVNKYGRYAGKTKTITLGDLIKFHGHFCGGLVESAGALKVAFEKLFPSGIVNRTDLHIASNNSACGGDVAAYLTGARTRFGSHILDPELTESEFVVQEASTGITVRVRVKPEPIRPTCASRCARSSQATSSTSSRSRSGTTRSSSSRGRLVRHSG
jgi:hypothetical protein